MALSRSPRRNELRRLAEEAERRRDQIKLAIFFAVLSVAFIASIVIPVFK